jgi:hypothetical protein
MRGYLKRAKLTGRDQGYVVDFGLLGIGSTGLNLKYGQAQHQDNGCNQAVTKRFHISSFS